MNKQQLASLIWDSCNDLRGSISAVEYKDVILGLIFYRFVSEKEVMELKKQDWTDEAMAEELNEEDSETIKWCQEHLGYYIAYENLFSTWIHNVEGNFSVADVTKALNAFVRNTDSKADHQKLYTDIFKSLSEKLTKIGSIAEQTSHLRKVIKVVDRIPMDEHRGYDVLGFIYEFLLKNFASNSKKDGEFYTPHEISILMSEIIAHHLQDREQINILDPTSGSGSLLIHIGQSVQKYLQDSGNITYYAQELIQETFDLTRMNLVMRGIKPSNIKVRRGDTLAADWPYFDDNDENSYEYVPVDCVVSNPPYDKWQGNQRRFTHRDELRMIIDAALRMQPDGFDALMQLLEDAGCRIKRGVHISIKPPEGKRYIRLDTLGSEYDETSLCRTLAHDHVHIPKIPRGDFNGSQVKRLIDIEAKLHAGKGKGYQVWAERNNIDAKAQMIIFLKEHQIDSLEELNEQIQELTNQQKELKAALREKQNRMKEINRQRQTIRDYSRTKEVYTQYRESGWSVKFYQEHRQEIEDHRNAQAVYSSLDGKIPTLKELTAEYDGLKERKENDQAALDKLKPKLTDLKHIRYNYEILERDSAPNSHQHVIPKDPHCDEHAPHHDDESR